MLDLDRLDFTKGGGLVTVVAQDAVTGAVLMVALALVCNCACGFVDCRPYLGKPTISWGVTPPRTLSPSGNPVIPNSSRIDGPPTDAGVRSIPSRETENRRSTTSLADFVHTTPMVPA